MAKHGKKYTDAAKLVDRMKDYAPAEAVELLKQVSYPKFNSTIEVHVRLGVDPRHADQQVRSTVLLPAGLGKTVRILVFAEGDGARLAEQAGADYVGLDDMIAKIQGGWLEFDMAIATPQVMGKVGRLGRILGTRGLMPNPKAGTIVQPDDLPRAITGSAPGPRRVQGGQDGQPARAHRQDGIYVRGNAVEPRCVDGCDPARQAQRGQRHLHSPRDFDIQHGAGHPPGYQSGAGDECRGRLAQATDN